MVRSTFFGFRQDRNGLLILSRYSPLLVWGCFVVVARFLLVIKEKKENKELRKEASENPREKGDRDEKLLLSKVVGKEGGKSMVLFFPFDQGEGSRYRSLVHWLPALVTLVPG